MPEGVEVRISAELIKPLVYGKKVIWAETYPTSRYATEDPRGMKDFLSNLTKEDVRVVNVETRGKFMWWSFTNFTYLMCTFGMTGQWSPTKGKHPCFSFTFLGEDGEEKVYFNDPRHFGTIEFAPSFAVMNEKRARFVWDPLNDTDSDGNQERRLNYVYNKLLRTNKPIGQMLMDQSLFSGVGNYIRAEALYLARMSPWRPSNKLKKEEFLVLVQAIIDVMNESYKHQGATILTYKDAYGAEGRYSSCFKVYGQKTDPLGNPIVKEETPDKRTIHWCPALQV